MGEVESANSLIAVPSAPTLRDVYDEHFQFVWRSLRRLGIAEQDVKDVVQDVFMIVHRKLPEFRGESKLTTWLFGICMRVARDRRRLAHVRREVPSGDDLGERLSEDVVTDELERREAAGLLERILDEMPLEQRAVFTLFELEERRCEDIAELLGIPVGTVYSRLRLAREVFRRGVARRQAHERFQLGILGGQAP
jgi:RNA polymerase sigma-70 factor, ECF subfamily